MEISICNPQRLRFWSLEETVLGKWFLARIVRMNQKNSNSKGQVSLMVPLCNISMWPVKCWDPFLHVVVVKRKGCASHDVEIQKWVCRRENASDNGAFVPPSSMIFIFCGASIASLGGCYNPLRLPHADILKALVLQEISEKACSEMFLSDKAQKAYLDAISLSKT